MERIKVAIARYNLTPDQLFGTSESKAGKVTSGRAAGNSGGVKSAGNAAYADGSGNEWGGRGPRPRWLRDALAAGKSLDEFAAASTSTKSVTPAAVKKAARKRKAKQTYRDEAGHTWSGFGPRPKWLREASAAGATLEQFAT